MAKYDKKRIQNLIKKIETINKNIFTNKAMIETYFEPLFSKSSHFDKSIVKEDNDTLKIQYEILSRNNFKSIYTNKAIHKKAVQYVKKYEKYGNISSSTAVKRFTTTSRDEYIALFKELSCDNNIIRFLKDSGLWGKSEFWQKYFNSSYFIPLYHKYSKNELSTTTQEWQKKSGSKHTIWEDSILSFANKFLKENGKSDKIKYKSYIAQKENAKVRQAKGFTFKG